MTKRDFKLVAKAISKIKHPGYRAIAALELAKAFETEYPNFDQLKFFQAVEQTEESQI